MEWRRLELNALPVGSMVRSCLTAGPPLREDPLEMIGLTMIGGDGETAARGSPRLAIVIRRGPHCPSRCSRDNCLRREKRIDARRAAPRLALRRGGASRALAPCSRRTSTAAKSSPRSLAAADTCNASGDAWAARGFEQQPTPRRDDQQASDCNKPDWRPRRASNRLTPRPEPAMAARHRPTDGFRAMPGAERRCYSPCNSSPGEQHRSAMPPAASTPGPDQVMEAVSGWSPWAKTNRERCPTMALTPRSTPRSTRCRRRNQPLNEQYFRADSERGMPTRRWWRAKQASPSRHLLRGRSSAGILRVLSQLDDSAPGVDAEIADFTR